MFFRLRFSLIWCSISVISELPPFKIYVNLAFKFTYFKRSLKQRFHFIPVSELWPTTLLYPTAVPHMYCSSLPHSYYGPLELLSLSSWLLTTIPIATQLSRQMSLFQRIYMLNLVTSCRIWGFHSRGYEEYHPACHLLTRWFTELFFDPEDGGDTFLRNFGYNSTHYTAHIPGEDTLLGDFKWKVWLTMTDGNTHCC
jgi:hypothetical protein